MLETQPLSQPPFQRTRIPNHSIVVSQVSLAYQAMLIEFDELTPYFEWIKHQRQSTSGEDLVRKASLLTINNLKPGLENWDKMRRASPYPTLGACIKAEANSCFQRGVFLNLLLQQVDIPTATVNGFLVNSPRNNIREQPPERTKIIMGRGCRIGYDDEYDAHIWNFVQLDAGVFFVDASLLDEDRAVIQAVSYNPRDPYTRVQLSTGSIRHYISDSLLEVHPQSKRQVFTS